MIESVRALLQFCTVLPLGRPAEFEAFARRSYLYPLSGYVTGGLAGLAAAAVSNPAIGAAVGLGAVLLVTGAHHLDGLLDLGDGLMAHGGRDVRIRALLDRQVGAGGLALGMTVLLLAWSGLSSAPSLLWALVAAEVLGRFGMALLTVVGTPFREGIRATSTSARGPGSCCPRPSSASPSPSSPCRPRPSSAPPAWPSWSRSPCSRSAAGSSAGSTATSWAPPTSSAGPPSSAPWPCSREVRPDANRFVGGGRI